MELVGGRADDAQVDQQQGIRRCFSQVSRSASAGSLRCRRWKGHHRLESGVGLSSVRPLGGIAGPEPPALRPLPSRKEASGSRPEGCLSGGFLRRTGLPGRAAVQALPSMAVDACRRFGRKHGEDQGSHDPSKIAQRIDLLMLSAQLKRPLPVCTTAKLLASCIFPCADGRPLVPGLRERPVSP